MRFKCESSTFLTVPHELEDRVFEPARLEGDNWRLTDEELMLHNATWLKHTRHESKVTTSVDTASIREEGIRISPEAIRILVLKVPHLMRTPSSIRIFGVGRSANNYVYFELVLVEDLFGSVEDQMHSLLRGDTTDEAEERHGIVEIAVAEVLLLDYFLGGHVVRSDGVELLEPSVDGDSVREGEGI